MNAPVKSETTTDKGAPKRHDGIVRRCTRFVTRFARDVAHTTEGAEKSHWWKVALFGAGCISLSFAATTSWYEWWRIERYFFSKELIDREYTPNNDIRKHYIDRDVIDRNYVMRHELTDAVDRERTALKKSDDFTAGL